MNFKNILSKGCISSKGLDDVNKSCRSFRWWHAAWCNYFR